MKREITIMKWCIVVLIFMLSSMQMKAQNESYSANHLTEKQQNLISIAALTANGDLQELKTSLDKSLNEGLTINQIKELMGMNYQSVSNLLHRTIKKIKEEHKDIILL